MLFIITIHTELYGWTVRKSVSQSSSELSENSPKISISRLSKNSQEIHPMDCPKVVQKSIIQSQIFGTGMHDHFRPQNTKTICIDFQRELNHVGENLLSLGVFRNSPIPVFARSSRRGETLFLLLQQKPTVRSLGNLEGRSSFSLYSLILPSFSVSFSPQFLLHRIVWSKVNCDVLFATCHIPIGSLGLPLSPYPNFWIFLLLSCDTWPSLGLWFD